MMLNHFRCFRVRLRARRAARRFEPSVGGAERLESRALLHAGLAAPHAVAVAPAVRHPGRARPHIWIAPIPPDVQTIQTRDATILVPTNLTPGKTYPLVVAFAYDANPQVPFQVWAAQAAAHDWIVYASKDFSNPVLRSGLGPSDAVAARVKAQVDALSATLPIDRSRIILTGMSGAGNYADFMNLRYPGYAAAVIINSGRIPMQLFRETPTPGFAAVPSAADFGSSRRVGVFLASPGDTQFYGVSQANTRFMQGLGWDATFISFQGRHWNAPERYYDQAIAWILAQPSWTADS